MYLNFFREAMTMRLHLFGIGLLLLAPGLTACGQGTRAEDVPAAPPEKVVSVAVRTVSAEDMEETFTLPGTLEAWEDLTLAAEVAGPVRWIGPREGDRVRRGEPILRIDPETAEANLARTQAEYAEREKRLQRLEQLLAQKFVSQQEFDEAQRTFEVARAELVRARLAVEKSTLTSPVDGILDRLLVDRGEYVAEGAPVAMLVQVDRLKALVEVPEKDIPFLRPGQKARVLPAAIAGEAAGDRPGEIIHLAYKAEPATRTYLTKVAVANGARDLRPGMIVRVSFLRRQLPGAVAIPLYAVVERGGGKAVFIDQEGTARLRPVRTGAVIGERIVVEEGLAPGDRLLVKGQHLVGDGSRISATEG